MHHRPFTLLAAFLLALAAPRLDAAVHVVDDNGGAGVDFTSISAAVAAAVDGDLILVKAGSYGGFTISDKALTITADLGQVVSVAGLVTIQNLSAAKQLAMSGLDVDANSGGEALILQGNDGPILIENGAFIGSGLPIFQVSNAARVATTANVTFVDCSFAVGFGSGGLPALQVTVSDVHLYGCSMFGGAQTIETLPGGAGCQMSGGFLFASDCTFVGGQGGAGAPPDIFVPCSDGGAGGPGLLASGGAVIKILDCSFTGGSGGLPADLACNPGPSGPGQQIISGSVQTFPYAARTYDIPSPVREGTNGSITLDSDPGEYAWLFFSVFQSPSYAGSIKGTLLPGTPSIIIFLGQLPGGPLTFNVPVPIEPSMQSFALIEQAVYWTQAKGFQVSNPRLGVVLDQSL